VPDDASIVFVILFKIKIRNGRKGKERKTCTYDRNIILKTLKNKTKQTVSYQFFVS